MNPNRENAARSVRAYWANMTKEQRSAEMKRRHAIARKKQEYRLRQKASTDDPFKGLVKAKRNSPITIRERLIAIESAVAALRADLGL
jgi:hypothetical protein